MRKFYYDNEEGGGEEEDEDEENEEENEEDKDFDSFEMPFASELIAMSQNVDPFKNTMDSAIKVCEGGFWWKFMSMEDRIKNLHIVFKTILELEKEYRNAEI